ncbi:MAG: 2-hydroxychromene-2-carboxylate isomerase [Thermoplasmatota archaeon]
MRLHAYFDYGSPYAYLAWYRITQRHPERYEGVDILWKPVSAGHIFKQDGSAPNTTMPNQGRYLHLDVKRWADAYGAPFQPPTEGAGKMPVNSIQAMRLHFLADQGGPAMEAAWMKAVFHAYFGQGRDISSEAVLDDLCAQVGVQDGPQACNHESIKRLLIANTAEAYEAGAPGVPFFVLETDEGNEVFWGNDRCAWMEARIAGQVAPA